MFITIAWIVCIVLLPNILNYRDHLKGNDTAIENIKIGLILKEHTPENAKVADFYAGSVFYFSHRYGVDLLGKCDTYIAHLLPASDGKMPGHNKFAFDYSFQKYKPDYIVAMFQYPADSVHMLKEAKGDFAFIGQLYFNKTFRNDYYPNYIKTNTKRSIYKLSQNGGSQQEIWD